MVPANTDLTTQGAPSRALPKQGHGGLVGLYDLDPHGFRGELAVR